MRDQKTRWRDEGLVRTHPDSDKIVHMKRDGWTFLTNQGHVLVCLAADPDVLLRDVALNVGITERAVQQVVSDLESAGVITRLRVGRRNRYLVRRDERFRHSLEAGVTVGAFIDLVARLTECDRRASARAAAADSSTRRPALDVDYQDLGEPVGRGVGNQSRPGPGSDRPNPTQLSGADRKDHVEQQS